MTPQRRFAPLQRILRQCGCRGCEIVAREQRFSIVAQLLHDIGVEAGAACGAFEIRERTLHRRTSVANVHPEPPYPRCEVEIRRDGYDRIRFICRVADSMDKIWEPISIGRMSLKNRLAMAPMTRDRATPEGVPTASNATYYAQRATFGLIVTEGTQPSDDGQGYLLTPGIYTEEHIHGWKMVTDAVHAAGGRIYIQLMHVGRMAHPSNTPHGRQPVAPSAVRPAGKMMTASGPQNLPEPRALSAEEIAATVRDFRHAASCAIAAGADGVEIHAANGYLPHQFLSENANRRTDAYGGSIKNRIRFTLEVAAAVADEIGADRTAIHLSPGNTLNDIVEGDTAALYHAMITQLAPLDLAFLSLVQAEDEELLRSIRRAWPTAMLVNRLNRARADIAVDVDAGLADMASVGRFALANSDLVLRLQRDTKLNEADQNTFYGGGERGYTDYPTSTVSNVPAGMAAPPPGRR
jgi:N-ethylmaleimide reductase